MQLKKEEKKEALEEKAGIECAEHKEVGEQTGGGVSDSGIRYRRKEKLDRRNLRKEKRGRVRHGSLSNIEELWKKKREESEEEKCFNRTKETIRTPEKEKMKEGKEKYGTRMREERR